MHYCLEYSDDHLEIDVPDNIDVRTSIPERRAVPDVSRAVDDALDSPFDYPALRLALTPGDHVAVVVDERLPHLPQLLTPILQHIVSAQVEPDNITLLTHSAGRQEWLDDLPDIFQDARLEVHDPSERKKLSYLAATKKGRRIYLNRTIVDADQLVVLAGTRYDASLGYGGGEGAIYPAFSDEETRRQINRHFSMRAPESDEWPWREEASEVSWLLGAPFFVHVIEGARQSITDVIAGPAASATESRRLLDARWRVEVDNPAEVVVATVSGNSSRDHFTDVASAFAAASRVVRSNGHIVVLSGAVRDDGPQLQMLRQSDEPAEAMHLVQKSGQWDMGSAFQWANAAEQAHLLLMSDLPAITVEELFSIPLEDAKQIQRLIDVADSCLVLPDAHQTYAVVR